jgi:hypothetical protein
LRRRVRDQTKINKRTIPRPWKSLNSQDHVEYETDVVFIKFHCIWFREAVVFIVDSEYKALSPNVTSSKTSFRYLFDNTMSLRK